MTATATAAATPATHFETGAKVYKPTIRYKGGTRKSEILHSDHDRLQGATFPTRQEAIESAERIIALRRADVVRRAIGRGLGGCSEAARRHLQGEFALWGGEGSVFDSAPGDTLA